jgi:NTP pyrophosphatase (non-canonical NTP hydrolase)
LNQVVWNWKASNNRGKHFLVGEVPVRGMSLISIKTDCGSPKSGRANFRYNWKLGRGVHRVAAIFCYKRYFNRRRRYWGATRVSESQLTLNQAQDQVDQWIKTIGVRYFSELTNLAQLVEEVGELARIISRTYGEQSFKDSEKDLAQKSVLADEMADVMFVLICLANQTGVNLADALKKNLAKKTIRDKDRHHNNPKLK